LQIHDGMVGYKVHTSAHASQLNAVFIAGIFCFYCPFPTFSGAPIGLQCTLLGWNSSLGSIKPGQWTRRRVSVGEGGGGGWHSLCVLRVVNSALQQKCPKWHESVPRQFLASWACTHLSSSWK